MKQRKVKDGMPQVDWLFNKTDQPRRDEAIVSIFISGETDAVIRASQ